jgi:hypothetical protein
VGFPLESLPEPAGHWIFRSTRIWEGELVSVAGPNLKVSGLPIANEGGLAFDGPSDSVTYPWYAHDRWPEMPRQAFTIDLLTQLNRTDQLAGLAGCIFTAEEGTRGWSLTIEEGDAVFRVATDRGSATVRAPNVPTAQFVAFTASYDLSHLRLYANGELVDESAAPLGEIALNSRAPFAVGGWWQGDKTLGFSGTVRSFAIYGAALTEDEVVRLSPTREPMLAPLPSPVEPEELAFVIEPTIQQVTTESATIVWESNGTTQGEVRFGEGNNLDRVARSEGAGRIHKVPLSGLRAATPYTFQVRAVRPDGQAIGSPVGTFTTMPLPGQSLRFGIVGDTQDRPQVNARVAAGMRGERPAFGIVVGDLVNTGWEKEQWTHDFFGSMRALWSCVPLFPALGNHDRNARLYYDLLALPAPYYRYSFRAGDAEFFVLDTERDVAPGSDQYQWLDAALESSRAAWKIVIHHYPPYSSDLDDYGTDLGDVASRQLVPLYDLHRVDVVFSGHIHSYERTHPMRGEKVAANGDGTTYVVTGGGGGDLEQFLPEPPDFSAFRKSDYHYGIVDVTSHSLTFRAYDLDGQLFDTFTLRKARK